ncbi:hypothetical protein V2J09_014502 [Rumex salicifolius]
MSKESLRRSIITAMVENPMYWACGKCDYQVEIVRNNHSKCWLTLTNMSNHNIAFKFREVARCDVQEHRLSSESVFPAEN